jgi:integrase
MTSIYNKVLDYIDTLNKQSLNDELKATKIVDFILNLDVSNSYKSSTITKIKKYLTENNMFSNPDFYKLVKAPTEFYNDLFENTKSNRLKKQPKTLNQNDINILFNLKNSDDPWKLYIWLLFVSGRRLNELFDNKISKISIDKIKLDFISKKENIPDENIVHLLVPSNDFFDVLNKFINLKKTTPVLNKLPYYQTAINRTLKKLKLSNNELTSHSLRKTYLTYMVDVKKFKPDLMPSVRAKILLNHNNENTSTFYNGAVKLDNVDNDVVKNIDKYNCMKIPDIKKLLDDNSIKYKSKMKKNQLIALIPV